MAKERLSIFFNILGKMPISEHFSELLFMLTKLVLVKENKTCFSDGEDWGTDVYCSTQDSI